MDSLEGRLIIKLKCFNLITHNNNKDNDDYHHYYNYIANNHYDNYAKVNC